MSMVFGVEANHVSSSARRDTSHGSAKQEEKRSTRTLHVSVPRVALLLASLHRTSIEEKEESLQRQQGFLSPKDQQKTLQLNASGSAVTSSVDQPGSSGEVVGALRGDQPIPRAATDRSRRASVEEFLLVGVEQDSDGDDDDVDTGAVTDATQDLTTVVQEDKDMLFHADEGKGSAAVETVAVAAKASNTPQPADDGTFDSPKGAKVVNLQVDE